ncbi:plant virulence effector HPE1-like domain-containing protein [Rhizobium sp. SL42]|uniref:plant virulence effector HPE1-like domain-containing protein n=1 Tax=Rhizobium sp. SL42 TaxID=2806346 RepID=UPI001F46DF43|nr:plant virulence effector HPE1-like domain-containing protein [Rhizobium sp. SL42]UJW76268.1 hypothetical protein IM739_07235 [Rhizobium sp. SL42]
MRKFLLTAMLLAGTSPAFASSIEVISGTPTQAHSITAIACPNCPPPQVKKDKHAYQVPTVPSGSQTAEILDVGGEKKLKRIESWLGGSPVVIMSSAEGWSTNGSMVIAGNAPSAGQIDHEATTAAVNVAPPADGKLDLDTAGFDLRLK